PASARGKAQPPSPHQPQARVNDAPTGWREPQAPRSSAAHPQTLPQPHPHAPPPAPPAHPQASHPPAPDPSRSNPPAADAARPQTEAPAGQSQHPAPQPRPPEHEQAATPAPQRSRARTSPLDNPAAAAAAGPGKPSVSVDKVWRGAHGGGRAQPPPQAPTGCYAPPGSSQTPPTCRTARPIQPAAGSRKARDAGAQSIWIGCPAPA